MKKNESIIHPEKFILDWTVTDKNVWVSKKKTFKVNSKGIACDLLLILNTSTFAWRRLKKSFKKPYSLKIYQKVFF